MKGFVFVTVGLALIYVALSGKAGALIVAILTGQTEDSGTNGDQRPPTNGPTEPIIPDPNRPGTGTGS